MSAKSIGRGGGEGGGIRLKRKFYFLYYENDNKQSLATILALVLRFTLKRSSITFYKRKSNFETGSSFPTAKVVQDSFLHGFALKTYSCDLSPNKNLVT